jgi:orotidine-5'-phosphate decarboxylase
VSADARGRLAFPLDYRDVAEARRGAALVSASVGVLKIGLELFVSEGPSAAALGAEFGCDVFLDLKLHDIPATVDAAVASAAALRAKYLTVHASGGSAMVAAAVRRAERDAPDLTILAVTVLTSLDDADLTVLGIPATASEHALHLARVAYDAGARGFVCSPADLLPMRAALGSDVVLVAPGIRPAGVAAWDQKRTGTPRQAILDGASLLVVGRPIREAKDPSLAARNLLDEIDAAASEARRS